MFFWDYVLLKVLDDRVVFVFLECRGWVIRGRWVFLGGCSCDFDCGCDGLGSLFFFGYIGYVSGIVGLRMLLRFIDYV